MTERLRQAAEYLYGENQDQAALEVDIAASEIERLERHVVIAVGERDRAVKVMGKALAETARYREELRRKPATGISLLCRIGVHDDYDLNPSWSRRSQWRCRRCGRSTE